MKLNKTCVRCKKFLWKKIKKFLLGVCFSSAHILFIFYKNFNFKNFVPDFWWDLVAGGNWFLIFLLDFNLFLYFLRDPFPLLIPPPPLLLCFTTFSYLSITSSYPSYGWQFPNKNGTLKTFVWSSIYNISILSFL